MPEAILSPEIERKGAVVEFKFISDAQPGIFEGYGSIFNNIDSYGDIILPGAFAQSLSEHKAKGTMPGLYAEHSIYTTGGDLLPVGTWMDIAEDDKGLRVKGKISALDTDYGRRIRGLMQDGALRGLSIAYQVPKGGASFSGSKKPDEAKRTLRQINLASVDIVRDPANPSAVIDAVKSLLTTVDHAAACKSVAACLKMHMATMSGNDSPTADERAQMLQHLKDAHKALTGYEMPAGMKAMPMTIREIERLVRETFSLSNTQAREVAAHGFKSLIPREEGQDEAAAVKAAHHELASALAEFSLPNL
jgi:HK97 family phage prohead protease